MPHKIALSLPVASGMALSIVTHPAQLCSLRFIDDDSSRFILRQNPRASLPDLRPSSIYMDAKSAVLFRRKTTTN